jgi:hypothetical protein
MLPAYGPNFAEVACTTKKGGQASSKAKLKNSNNKAYACFMSF